MKSLFTKIRELLFTPTLIGYLRHDLRKMDLITIQNGKALAIANKHFYNDIKNNIHLAEFKVFSEWGDDGIIQFLVDHLDIKERTFIEFGVEDYSEANTRFLLINNNWRGLIIDGSEQHMQKVKREDIYWRYNLTAVPKFITAENINELFTSNGFSGKIGLLHIDIDGNDYWVWKAITAVDPEIVIVEYNSVFGIEHPWTISYDPAFFRTNFHYSNLYFGSSLLSLCDLATEKGYAFIGCNSNGNNAYFVKQSKLNGIKALSPQEGYVLSQFKESRDKEGKLTFLSGSERLKLLKGTKIFNTRTGKEETI